MEIVESLKSLWRLYSSENSDFQVGFCWKRCAPKAVDALQRHPGRSLRRQRGTGGGVRGGKPPQGTGGRTYSSIDAIYLLDRADLRRCA